MIHPRLMQAGIGMALLVGGLAVYVMVQDGCNRRQGRVEELLAAQAAGEAIAREKLAKAKDAEVQDAKAKADLATENSRRAIAERDAALRALAAKRRPDPPSEGATVEELRLVVTDLTARLDAAELVILKDADTIEAQAKELSVVKESLTAAIQRGDEWKATAEARERQAMAQEAAVRAWKQAVNSSRWRGRMEGFAAGIAVGLVGGRR